MKRRGEKVQCWRRENVGSISRGKGRGVVERDKGKTWGELSDAMCRNMLEGESLGGIELGRCPCF